MLWMVEEGERGISFVRSLRMSFDSCSLFPAARASARVSRDEWRWDDTRECSEDGIGWRNMYFKSGVSSTSTPLKLRYT